MIDQSSGVGAVSGVGRSGPLATGGVGPTESSTTVAGSSFETVLSQLSETAVSNLKSGEATALAGLQGKATTREVVDAVMKAEQSLQTVVAVRDKLILAYQEISRMNI